MARNLALGYLGGASFAPIDGISPDEIWDETGLIYGYIYIHIYITILE